MTNKNQNDINRRSFLIYTGTSGVLATIIAMFGATLRYVFPNVFYELSQRMDIGEAGLFNQGTTTFLQEAKVFLHRSQDGIHAISATCTHLGCVISKSENGFACPCHGSVFDENGNVQGGPAPRALPWYEVSLSPEGRLIVDKSRPVVPGTKLIV